MALARCILGKFLGVGCHFFPPPLDVPTFSARCLHVQRREICYYQYYIYCTWPVFTYLPTYLLIYSLTHSHTFTLTHPPTYPLNHSLAHSTHSLTSWCRVLLEKPTGVQPVKKFSALYGTRRFIIAVTSARHTWPIHSKTEHTIISTCEYFSHIAEFTRPPKK